MKKDLDALQKKLGSYEPRLTAKEYAALNKVNVHTVYRQIRKGILPVIRIGNLIRIVPSEANAALAQRSKHETD